MIITPMKLMTAGILLGMFIAFGAYVVLHPASVDGTVHYALPAPYHVDAASITYTPDAPIVAPKTTDASIDYATPIQGAQSPIPQNDELTAKQKRMIEIINEINALYAELQTLQAQ